MDDDYVQVELMSALISSSRLATHFPLMISTAAPRQHWPAEPP